MPATNLPKEDVHLPTRTLRSATQKRKAKDDLANVHPLRKTDSKAVDQKMELCIGRISLII
jgi:hypothetical protein